MRLNRLLIRNNWPLWLACLLCLLAVAYLIFFLASPLRPPYEGAIIYLFLSIYQTTTGYLFCFSAVFLLIVFSWTCLAIRDKEFIWIIVVGAVSVALCNVSANFLVGFFILF